ncbi:MAG: hypothetical protein PHH84_02895 [Oscillospiraceae bacterium]|nr:hypothetical protein [Oscillospiraceae bacterium]MDD4413561.1 hypothetical protein [Oscillospiraceae bacterium]
MIKGVNRQIIEVTETGNEYFERAFLVVRPSFADTVQGRLHDEARRFLRNAQGYSGLKINRARNLKNMIIRGCSYGAAGALIGALLMSLVR